MRTFTFVTSSTSLVTAKLALEVTAADASTTWTFSGSNLVGLSPISWEVPFAGGLGKTSKYTATLATSLDWIKTYQSQLIKAQTNLKVTLNDSDTFYPHKGRVRGLERVSYDQVKLNIYDLVLDGMPRFPDSIVDSYPGTHPKVISEDIGYPVYYGLHHRPFYHVPVDCSVKTLLGPRNVSSENHVSSVFFNAALADGHAVTRNTSTDFYEKNIFLTSFDWAQQSDSTNIMSRSMPFEIKDFSLSLDATLASRKVFSFPGQPFSVSSRSLITENQRNAHFIQSSDFVVVDVESTFSLFHSIVQLPFDVETLTNVLYNTMISSITTGAGSYELWGISFIGEGSTVDIATVQVARDVNSYGGANAYSVSGLISSGDWTGPAPSIFNRSQYGRGAIGAQVVNTGLNVAHYMRQYLAMAYALRSREFKPYSIFSPVVNSADVAVSQNPMFQVAHIFSEFVSIPFVQAQNSAAQLAISNSYNGRFHSIFYERQPLDDILDEYGKISGTHLWIGDSGMMNFRYYQESYANMHDLVVTHDDILKFKIVNNPLGASQYSAKKAKRFVVNFAYNFTTSQHEKVLEVNPTNNALCDSAQAAGIDDEVILKTRYVIDSATAFNWCKWHYRAGTQDEELYELELPARFFRLEACDKLKIQHPMIVGSEQFAQVVKIDHDYQNGTVSLTAQKVLNT